MSENVLCEEALLRIPSTMRAGMREYAQLLHEMAGENLLGLTLFGAVLDTGFDPSRMAAASMMVLKGIDLDLLNRLAGHGPSLGKKHVRAPMVMTPEYITASLDTFPLELLEIHQRHATLLGTDFFDTLKFESSHMRLQCEREFKRILVRMRQGLLAAAGREKVLGELEQDIGEHLLRTLRGLLWLKGKKQYLARDDVLSESETLTDGKLTGVRNAIGSQRQHDGAEFGILYEEVEKLAKVADEL